jgi:hypothetical protein
MPEYQVVWRMDIEADSAEEAAEKALAVHRDPQSIATVFEVTTASLNSVDEEDQRVVIDLIEDLERKLPTLPHGI